MLQFHWVINADYRFCTAKASTVTACRTMMTETGALNFLQVICAVAFGGILGI